MGMLALNVRKWWQAETWSLHSSVNCRVESSVEFEGFDYSVTEYRIAVLED